MQPNSFLVLVCGGKAYKNDKVIFSALDTLHSIRSITELINGNAEGADQISTRWARWAGVPYTIYRAEWNIHGKKAGFIRNQIMANRRPDLGVAFPGGNGTYDMIGRLVHMHIPVWKPLEERCPIAKVLETETENIR